MMGFFWWGRRESMGKLDVMVPESQAHQSRQGVLCRRSNERTPIVPAHHVPRLPLAL